MNKFIVFLLALLLLPIGEDGIWSNDKSNNDSGTTEYESRIDEGSFDPLADFEDNWGIKFGSIYDFADVKKPSDEFMKTIPEEYSKIVKVRLAIDESKANMYNFSEPEDWTYNSLITALNKYEIPYTVSEAKVGRINIRLYDDLELSLWYLNITEAEEKYGKNYTGLDETEVFGWLSDQEINHITTYMITCDEMGNVVERFAY